MDETQKRKLYNFLIWSSVIFYITTLISKNIFTAQLVNIVDYLGVDKAEAQLCSTYYFFPYAIGQLLVAPFIKKIDLKKALFITVLFSSLIIISMAFGKSITFFYVTHAFNGALQVLTWVGVMAICSKYLPSDMIPKANKLLSFSFAFGVGLAYAIAAFFSVINLWQGTFVFSGVITIIALIFFLFIIKRVDKIEKPINEEIKIETKSKEKSACIYNVKKNILFFYAFDILACLAVYAMYYSIMPNVTFFFKEEFNMDPSLSILITVCFPIVLSFGSVLCISICEKFKRYFLVSSIFSLTASVFAGILVFTFKIHFLLSLILLILILFFSRGGSSVLGTIVILDLRKEINTGKFTAINNAFASITASVMPPLMATIIPNGNPNWKLFFIVCIFIGLGSSIITFIFDFLFKKKGEN